MLNFKFLITKSEVGQMILKGDGAELVWSGDKLPAGMAAGQTVFLTLMTEEEAGKDKDELAKKILNEILRV